MNDSASQPSSSGRPTHFWREEIGLAVMFLTRLPWPGRLPESRPLMAAAWAFPVVGVGVGLIAAFAYWIAQGVGLPASVAALAAIAAAAVATGALHEDGLADVADGFGGGADADAKRRIMRDSHIGSYGVLALVLATAAKVAALAALADVETAVVALVAAHALGRSAIPALAHWLPPAAPDGRGRDAGRPDALGALWAAGIGAGAALLILPAGIGLAAALATGGAAFAVGWLARRQIGGVTGDVFGAAEQVGEIAALFAIVSYLGS
ncbi:adenosylcobinamide-GDP ribazoletransferase [Thalassobaculum sp.]|uniref:adenosylcobinamide-GDP ribazoletransferase n=1 Tax=Thalassobaculum sp. TaxID=2022740 RepID=UPI0032EDDE88